MAGWYTEGMMWQIGMVNPESEGLIILAQILGLGLGVILHEVSHGYVALKLGDPTAKFAGRLTLNPIKHIDLWGTIILPLLLVISRAGFVIGWAKPVPVNYYNLKYGKYGPVLVALSGPVTNFVILTISALLARFSPADTALPMLFITVAVINGVLMMFNLVPVPPLDGSKVLYLFLEKRPDVMRMLEQYGMFIILALLLFGQGFFSRVVFEPAWQLTRTIAGF